MKEVIDPTRIPKHIAIIMDGNGRWAKQKGALRIFGHKNAVQAVKDAIEGAKDLGVKYLTLFSFSTENWSRPQDEVDGLMELLVKTITKQVPLMMKDNIRFAAMGDIDSMPDAVQKKLAWAKEMTKNNDGLILNLALSYSGRWELTQTFKRIAQKISEGKLTVDEVTQELIHDHLETPDIPDPELMIRTSGEFRISNFLLWQLAYTELHFTPVLWPDFRREHLIEAILDYQRRERRFGMTGEQVKP
ncbi:isoprenyl transferase [Algoriphagus sediminis]|uniref:Isoprenyl transferase n=1 Tax=Algoriphagus sediminis TaxID=3057113 RepID=A0ABT7YEW4_9BACT|nr:isoprenyl transferase [Algoriphagus sediminis]MDN3204870.1 isoprenyl transferase [Algoriphagus sediminis]